MNIKSLLIIMPLILCVYFVNAQVKIGDNPEVINDQSLLELESTSKVFVLPRLTNAQMNGVAPLDGSVIFNTDEGSLYQRSNGSWTSMASTNVDGDIKHGIQDADHSGWYILDGRAINTLPANAQSAAAALGLTGNLPDATDRFLKQQGSGEFLLDQGGNSEIAIARTNLPDISFPRSMSGAGNHSHTGTTSEEGDHSHSGSTDSGGQHNHEFRTANHDVNDSSSQGYPAGQNHRALRTTDRNERTEDGGIIVEAGDHTHTFTTDAAGNHSHSLTTNETGGHTHFFSVRSGGSDTPIEIYPSFLVVNTFIYLGE